MDRRSFMKMAAATGAAVMLPSGMPGIVDASNTGVLVKSIPSSGERIPVLGMGSWITFNVGNDAAARVEECCNPGELQQQQDPGRPECLDAAP